MLNHCQGILLCFAHFLQSILYTVYYILILTLLDKSVSLLILNEVRSGRFLPRSRYEEVKFINFSSLATPIIYPVLNKSDVLMTVLNCSERRVVRVVIMGTLPMSGGHFVQSTRT